MSKHEATGPQSIYPPEVERYVIVSLFARRILRNEATAEEVEFMNRFLSLDVDAETLFPDPLAYDDIVEAVYGLSDTLMTVA